jgi:hypothetical protein
MRSSNGREKPPSPALASMRSAIGQVSDTDHASSASSPNPRSPPRFLNDSTITYAIPALRGAWPIFGDPSNAYRSWRGFPPRIILRGFHKRQAGASVGEMPTHIGQIVK